MNQKLIFREIWLFLTLLLAVLFIIETAWQHSVQFYLNPMSVLIFWLIFGILYLYSKK